MSASLFADITEYRKVYGDENLIEGYRLPQFSSQSDLEGGYPPNWFLGPKAENVDLFLDLIADAVQSQEVFRRSFHPEDGAAIREIAKVDEEFLKGVDTLKQAYGELLASLRHDATPYYSWRYQGHMLWDTTLPAMLGYFATMLHNPNNVTIQASTLTTFLEQLVGWDLCGMLGFPFPALDGQIAGNVVPHGHLTSGGTVANIEATWSARELKYLPVAVHGSFTLTESPFYWYSDSDKRTVMVTRADGSEVSIIDLDQWDLLNIRQDSALTLPHQIHRLGPPDLPGDRVQLRWRERDVWEFLLTGSINAYGSSGFYAEFLSKEYLTPIGGPVILGPVTWHYSWPKAMALLGGGAGSPGVMPVKVDPIGRMDTDDLVLQLNRAKAARNPVLMVVAVLGSTEESAVDDVDRVLQIREEFRCDGFEFNVHVDAAWGGYYASLLRKDYRDPGDDNRLGSNDDPFFHPSDFTYARPEDGGPHDWRAKRAGEADSAGEKVFLADYPVFASEHVVRQLEAVRRADSATVDPHKTGYVPYPAGAITYRNGEIRRLVTFGAPVIGSSETLLSVGEFGVEGSKPGAAAAAVYLSHAVVRPSHSGHGRLMNASLINTRLFYSGLLELNRRHLSFITVPLIDLVTQDEVEWATQGGQVRDEYERWLAGTGVLPDGALRALAETVDRVLVGLHAASGGPLSMSDYEWMRALGPDLNIVDYMFNFRTSLDGPVNTDLRMLNRFNRAIYDRLHVPQGEIDGGALIRDVEVHDLPLLVSKTEIFRDTYGDDFVVPFLDRLGVSTLGPGRDRVVDILQTRDEEKRDVGERILDCYRKLIMMRSVIMDPFLHAKSDDRSFYVKEWMRIVGRVVEEVACDFRHGNIPDGDCSSD